MINLTRALQTAAAAKAARAAFTADDFTTLRNVTEAKTDTTLAATLAAEFSRVLSADTLIALNAILSAEFPTYSMAKIACNAFGRTLSRKNEYGEYRVGTPGNPAAAYHSDCLVDCIETARTMARMTETDDLVLMRRLVSIRF